MMYSLLCKITLLLVYIQFSVSQTTPFKEIEALEALYNNTNGEKWESVNVLNVMFLYENLDLFIGVPWDFTKSSDGSTYLYDPCNYPIDGGFSHFVGIHCVCSIECNVDLLWLNYAKLNGTLPKEIGQLNSLTMIDLANNNIHGSIPREIQSLVNLTKFDVSSNDIDGTIPPEITKLTKLQVLQLNDNNINSTIPSSIGQLTNLKVLYLQNNSFQCRHTIYFLISHMAICIHSFSL